MVAARFILNSYGVQTAKSGQQETSVMVVIDDVLLSDGRIPPVNVICSAHMDISSHTRLSNRKTPLSDTNKVQLVFSAIVFSRAVPDLFFSNPAGAGFCRIWNDKSGRSRNRSRIFKLTVILLI